MELYRLLMDSIKLFFINVFIFIILLEVYTLGILVRFRLNVELPFYGIFIAGIGFFIIIPIWMNIGFALQERIQSAKRLFIRVLISELPFALLIIILWALLLLDTSKGYLLYILVFGIVLLVLYPVVVLSAPSHLRYSRTEGR